MDARERVEWVDLAKGLTMVLIVLSHVLGKHYVALDWSIDLPARGAWLEFNRLFAPMRMPLFLMISGFLATGSLHRAWRPAFARRVANPYLLYLLWFTINGVFLVVFDFAQRESLELTASGLLGNLVFPRTTLWYMLALAVFFLAAKALHPLGVVAPIAAATLLSTAVFAEWLVVPGWMGMTDSLLRYFLPFLVGALIPSLPHRVAALRGDRRFLIAVVVYLTVAVAYRAGAAEFPLFGPAANVVGAATGIMLAVRLTTIRHLGSSLQSIGRRTLPVFVLHIPFIAVINWLATGPGADLWARMLTSALAAALYPAVVTGMGVVVCLAVHAGLLRLSAGWLFALPLGKQSPATPARSKQLDAPAV